MEKEATLQFPERYHDKCNIVTQEHVFLGSERVQLLHEGPHLRLQLLVQPAIPATPTHIHYSCSMKGPTLACSSS